MASFIFDPQVEHLLRRAGFGARPDELDTYRAGIVHRLGRRGSSNTTAFPTMWTARSGSRDTCRHERRASSRPRSNIARRAAALAVPDGAHQSSAPGEDDALLAQPLRDRVHEDRRPRRRGRSRRATWRRRRARIRAACAARSRCCATTRSATSATSSSTSPKTRRCCSGSTATRTRAPRPQENFGREIMELFTMGVGHYTEPDVYAAARVFTGWNLLTSRSQRHRGSDAVVSSSPTTPTSTTRRQDLQLSDLHGRQQDDSRALGGRRHAGRPRFHRGAGGESEYRTVSGEEALSVLRLRDRRRQRRLGQSRRRRLPVERLRHESRDARGADVERVLGFRQLLRALRVAGRVRRPRVEGHRLDRVLGRAMR